MKSGKIQCAHCTCMAGFSQTCIHVTACLFGMEAAIRAGLYNPLCISKSNELLSNWNKAQPMKVKDINFERGDFGKLGKRKQALVSSPISTMIPNDHYDPQ